MGFAGKPPSGGPESGIRNPYPGSSLGPVSPALPEKSTTIVGYATPRTCDILLSEWLGYHRSPTA